jgi:hypothetical protein
MIISLIGKYNHLHKIIDALDFSAKLPFYQPKHHSFQPNFRFISQICTLFSQTSCLSAKTPYFSAKLPFYQPKHHSFQPNFLFISQNTILSSQTSCLSAKTPYFSAKLPHHKPSSSLAPFL